MFVDSDGLSDYELGEPYAYELGGGQKSNEYKSSVCF
jgi:hypothetical protein